MVKASCSSATWMSFGVSLAMAKARSAAMRTAVSSVGSGRSCTACESVACPMPAMSTGVFVNCFAISAGASSTAEAPSLTGQQSKKRSGSAIHGLLLSASGPVRMPSIVTGMRRWAFGFFAPFSWFLMATIARCSRLRGRSAPCRGG